MSMQVVLRVAGIAALVVAALFAVLAVHYYLTNHIGEVMDDLSGKARARGVANLGSSGAAESRRRASVRRREAARGVQQAPAVTKGTVEPAATPAFSEPSVPAFPEPGAPASTAAPTAPNFDAPGFVDDEDDMATQVVEANFSTALGEAQTRASTSAALVGESIQIETSAGTFAFRVTRSIVLCDSDKIIASGGGM